MKNLGAMMQQAQKMQETMKTLQEELSNSEVTGSSGGGMVEITLSGKHETRAIKIDPSLVNAEDVSDGGSHRGLAIAAGHELAVLIRLAGRAHG